MATSHNRRKSTPEQFEGIVKFMTLHLCLIDPKQSTSLTNTQKEKLWKELCQQLNSMPGPKKNYWQWKRVSYFYSYYIYITK